MGNVTLVQATMIIDTALAKGREAGLKPLTVAVLDAGGHLVALKREDNSSILRPEIATGKAWGSLGMGFSSRAIRDHLQDRPTFINALAVASNGRFIPVPGGVVIKDKDRLIIGAVGISGDTSEKDEYCAIEGVRAAGLVPEPESPDPDWENT